jgi:PAS domain S-box-containing protein
MSGSGEIPQPLMLRWITKNGHVIWTEQRIIPTYDETGNLVALEGVARDITERKQTEEALRKSERRRRQAQQLARMGYWDWDVATETLHWSPEVFDIFGQDPQHFTPTAERFEALIHPEDREAFLEQRSQMLEAEGYASIEHRIVLPDGSTRHVLELAEVHRDAQGEVVQVSGTVQDITERKRTEEALSESEALLKRSQVMAHVGSWVFDAATEQLRWSEETYRIFGVRRSDFDPTYERFLMSVHPDDRAAVDAEFSESLKRGVEEYEIEHRIIRRDTGEIRWVHEKCEHVRDGAGALLRSVGMVQDITERRRAEEALREAHQCLEAFFEHSPRLAGIFDREGRYRMANPATAQALGRTPEDIAGQTFRELLSPEVAETFMNRIDRMVESQGPLAIDDQIVIGDEERIFETILFPLSWEGETPLTFGFMASDVTERKRAERELARYAAELKRSNRELEQLGYVLSHDLQEPARTVKGYLDLLARRCRGQLDSQTDTYIAHAMDGAERMQEMIRALLDLSRIETRGHTFAPVDVEALVERTLTMLQPTLEATAATVTYDALPTVHADPAQLAQVFQNLITNALKFRRDEVAPQVEISADRKDGAWHFSVADNGIGVDPKQADRVFQIFQRLHTREEYPGTGIGLALCRKVIERHGGRIWVESEPGEGATFYFTLPVRRHKQIGVTEEGDKSI